MVSQWDNTKKVTRSASFQKAVLGRDLNSDVATALKSQIHFHIFFKVKNVVHVEGVKWKVAPLGADRRPA